MCYGCLIPQFVNDPESWYIRTEKLGQSFARVFIDDPTSVFDFTRQLRDIILSGEDGYITLRTSYGGETRFVSHQAYAGNELFSEGLEIFIPYEEAIKYIDDIWFTLNFYAGNDGSMHLNYQLDIDLVSADLKPKFLSLYKSFYDLFSDGPCNKYKIIFTTEKGKGIGRYNHFHYTYRSLGFKSPSSFILDKTNPKDFQQKVASLVFYLIFIPNSFAVIKTVVGDSSGNFAYADALGLYTHKYVQSSAYKDRNYGGSFVWTDTSGPYTDENYKIWMQTFRGIFNPTDIRLFIAFSNKEGINTLDYLMKEFNRFLRTFGKSVGLDSNKFDGIIDLRK